VIGGPDRFSAMGHPATLMIGGLKPRGKGGRLAWELGR
jgi:hypothetical protein